MGDSRSIIQAYVDQLVTAATEQGVDWIDWYVSGGQLLLDLRPPEAFPYQLRVVPGGDEGNCFVTGDGAGAFYMTLDGKQELDKPVVKEIKALCHLLLDHLKPPVLEALGSYGGDDWSRITKVDTRAIVKAGHQACAVISVPDEPDALQEVAGEFPAMLPADDEFNDHYQSITRAQVEGAPRRRQVYIGADQDRVQRLAEADRRYFTSTDPQEKARAIQEVAGLFGTPRCCTGAYLEHLAVSVHEPDQVSWMRHVEGWAGPRNPRALPPRHPRLMNFLAARAHGLTFIDYWPCTPDCDETLYRHRRMLDDLYEEDDRRVVEEILGTSYLVWSDGRMVPFRIDAVEEDRLRVRDARTAAWAGLALERYRRCYLDQMPGGGRVADLQSLRPVRGGWQWSDGHRWRRIQGDRAGWMRRRPPLVGLFGGDA